MILIKGEKGRRIEEIHKEVIIMLDHGEGGE